MWWLLFGITAGIGLCLTWLKSKGILKSKVQAWWNDLDDNEQYELLEPYYPGKAHLMGLTE